MGRGVKRPASTNPPAWWTDADDAELDLLVWEFIDGNHDHLPNCSAEYVCPHLGQALTAILYWKHARELQSRAAYLRSAQDLAEWKERAA